MQISTISTDMTHYPYSDILCTTVDNNHWLSYKNIKTNRSRSSGKILNLSFGIWESVSWRGGMLVRWKTI